MTRAARFLAALLLTGILLPLALWPLHSQDLTTQLAFFLRNLFVGHLTVTGGSIPTLGVCGTGSVTAGSTDTAGEVTSTGAGTCAVVFGAAWTNTPSCVVTDETTAAALRISAIATTGFTVTNLTANDLFLFHCVSH